MTKEKREKVKQILINVGLIIGLVVLGLLILASIVGIILSLCNVCDLLAVSASVFVATISSFLTVLALILSVKSSNETIKLQNKLIELQIAKNESESISSINLIRNSLYLETIEIDKSLQPKEITNVNLNAEKGKLNLRIGLIFSARNINELSKISLKKFGLYFKYKLPNNEQLKLVLNNKSAEFNPIEIKKENTFIYEIITNINKKDYQDIINALGKTSDCGVKVDMRLALKCNDDMISIWERKNHNRLNFQLTKFDEHKQRYYFNKVAK